MRTLTKIIGGLVLLLSMVTTVMATPVDTYEFKSPENQKRALELAHSLRCTLTRLAEYSLATNKP